MTRDGRILRTLPKPGGHFKLPEQQFLDVPALIVTCSLLFVAIYTPDSRGSISRSASTFSGFNAVAD